jgi:uncharacterized protein DUF397
VEPVTGVGWRKSSYSNGGQQGSCVEVAHRLPGGVAVRDSTDPQGPRLTFTPSIWQAFTGQVKAGEHDPA